MAASVTSASGAHTGTAGAVTVTKPATFSVLDLFVAVISNDSQAAYTATPAGWVQAGANLHVGAGFMSVWTLQAGGSEPANYTWTTISGASVDGIIVACTGADPGGVAVTGGGSATTTTSMVAPSVTPSTLNALLLCGFTSSGASVTYTPPGGMTEQGDVTDTSLSLEVASLPLTTITATGTKTATASATGTYTSVSIVVNTPVLRDIPVGMTAVRRRAFTW